MGQLTWQGLSNLGACESVLGSFKNAGISPPEILIHLIWGGAQATEVYRGLCAGRVWELVISGFHKPGGEFVFSSKVEWEVTKGYLAEERWDLSNLFKRSL